MTTFCRFYLLLLSTYHVFTGLISFGWSGPALRFYNAIYATDPDDSSLLRLVLKPWGALSVCAGICGLFAAYDPKRYFGVVVALIVLLAMRVAYRFVCRDDLSRVARIPRHRNTLNIILLLIGLVILTTWTIMEWRS